MEKTINVNTKYGIINNVPVQEWSELEPFWADIVGSIIESVIENDFTIQDFRTKSQKGFIASDHYWKKYKKNFINTPLKEAYLFIESLKNKDRFIQAIKKFNDLKQTDWFNEKELLVLARFIRSSCLPILPFLISLKRKRGEKLL
jgi:hypothetical protein